MEDSSLCRICLKDGAKFPIFESTNDEITVSSKIFLCMQERLEDVEGYPRHICKTCNVTLDTVCIFINKFKETCKLLEEGFLFIKKENNNEFSDNATSEVEIELCKIKNDPDHDWSNESDLVPLIKPLELNIKKPKKERVKKSRKYKKKTKRENQTNKIASCILEGEFAWTGEKWCLKSSPNFVPQLKQPRKRQREIKLKLPKVKLPIPSKLCDICGDVFKSADKLLLHKKKVHFKTPVNCTKCSRLCASEYYLKRHMKRKHDGVRDFVCSICGKSFVFKGELSAHIKCVHRKEETPKKNYSCKLCDKTYKCAKSVIVHERSVHTGQRPAVCNVCGSSFFHIDYLKEHMRLHTGETPFKCPICGRGYAQRCNMKSHLRIHRMSELNAETLSKIKPNYLKLLKA